MKYWHWAALILLAFILSLWLSCAATAKHSICLNCITTITIYGPGYQRTVQAVAVDSVYVDSVRVK